MKFVISGLTQLLVGVSVLFLAEEIINGWIYIVLWTIGWVIHDLNNKYS